MGWDLLKNKVSFVFFSLSVDKLRQHERNQNGPNS